MEVISVDGKLLISKVICEMQNFPVTDIGLIMFSTVHYLNLSITLCFMLSKFSYLKISLSNSTSEP